MNSRRTERHQPFQAWIYHCHLHPLQAANCCRNSRLVVDEDVWKWVAFEKKYCYYLKNSRKIFAIKPLGYKIKSFFRNAKWCFNASWGLKGLNNHCVQMMWENMAFGGELWYIFRIFNLSEPEDVMYVHIIWTVTVTNKIIILEQHQ